MKLTDYMKWAQTGDIILSSGSSRFSKIIKEITGCRWSHVAIVIRGEDVGLSNSLYVWEATGKGVGEVEFLEACKTTDTSFFSRLTNYGAGDVAVRVIKGDRTDLMLGKLKKYMDENRGKGYEKDKLEMLKAVGWVKACGLQNNANALETQFCWEGAAGVLQAMGIFPANRPANSYSNVDFASPSLTAVPESGMVIASDLVLLD